MSGGKRRKLEALLGEIVVDLEGAARIQIEEERRREERRRVEAEWARQKEIARRKAEERRRVEAEWARQKEIARRKAEQVQRLEADLFGMVRAWQDAAAARAFLAAVEDRTPPELRTEGFAAWFAWEKVRADALDPLDRPEKVPKPLKNIADDDDDEDEGEPTPSEGIEPPRLFRQAVGVGAEWSHGPSGPRPGRG